MTDFFGGLFDDIAEGVNSVGDFFDEVIYDDSPTVWNEKLPEKSRELSSIGKGFVGIADSLAAQDQNKMGLPGIQSGFVNTSPSRGSAASVKAASSVNFDQMEQAWYYRMNRFAGLQGIGERMKVAGPSVKKSSSGRYV